MKKKTEGSHEIGPFTYAAVCVTAGTTSSIVTPVFDRSIVDAQVILDAIYGRGDQSIAGNRSRRPPTTRGLYRRPTVSSSIDERRALAHYWLAMPLRSFPRSACLAGRSTVRDPQRTLESGARMQRKCSARYPVWGLLFTVFVSLALGCDPQSRVCKIVYVESKPTEAQLRHARLACITPAVGHCDHDDVWTFHSTQKSETLTATITCKERRPWGRFELAGGSAPGVAEGEFPQAVWEALFRVVVDAKYCAGIGKWPMEVTTRGKVATCKSPRDDVTHLIAEAWGYTKRGPEERSVPGLGGICEIDPSGCRMPDDPCPPFQGDMWAGQRRPIAADPDPDAPLGSGPP